MHVFSLVVQLNLPSHSLKGKRGIVKSILARARLRFNVAVAEIDLQDCPDQALLAFATVTGSRAAARNLLEQLENWIIDERPDVELVATEYEER